MRHVRLSIPGKVMLAGEYAVLRGGHALAVTIDRSMIVDVTFDPGASKWLIKSNIWDKPRELVDLKSIQTDPLCRAVQAAAKRVNLSGGTVEIASNIEIADGIGSSSALRLGVCAAFQLLKNDRDLSRPSGVSLESVKQAWALQSENQGMASGYDIATQYVGGLVEFTYHYEENVWTPKWFKHDLETLKDYVHVFVGGNGAPTSSTLQTTASWLDGGVRFERLIDTSENLVDSFLNAIRWPSIDNFRRLIMCTSAQRAIFAAGPHFPLSVAEALANVPGVDNKWSWKTTGAGGEDALLLIGPRSALTHAEEALGTLGWHRLNAPFTASGIRIEALNSLTANPVPPDYSASSNPGAIAPRRRL